MKLPRLRIDLDRLGQNAEALSGQCAARGINVAAVTKVFCADPKMVSELCRRPIAYLADSRLSNIARYPDSKLERILLRAPAIRDCDEVARGCDISLHSELEAIRAMSEAAERESKKHGIVIMVDMGDLREGFYHTDKDEILKAADFAASREWLSLYGIGVNLTCYGGVVPDGGLMQSFAELARWLETRLRMRFRIVSGGNSSSLDLMAKGGIPETVNHLRLGESIVRAEETAYQKRLAGLAPDSVTLEAALVEIKEKPSYPEGDIGLNAFGEKPHFEDKGRRLRGIVAVGRQDTDPNGLACFDKGVQILGASSDHLIVDLTESDAAYRVGDALRFSMNYSAILRGFTSAYVERHYEGAQA